MHDGMQYDPIQGQDHEPLKSEIRPYSKAISSPFDKGGCQMTMDSSIRAQYLKLFGDGLLTFVLVFVSCDFEVGSTVNRSRPSVPYGANLLIKLPTDSFFVPIIRMLILLCY